jgi:hypothetical protein
MSNPLFLDNRVREGIKKTVEKAFNIDLTRFGGSEMDLYRHLEKTLKISATELSAKLYQKKVYPLGYNLLHREVCSSILLGVQRFKNKIRFILSWDGKFCHIG